MTFKEFKETHDGGFYSVAAQDIAGLYKKGSSMYGDCDDMEVSDYFYQPLNGIYTVYLTEKTQVKAEPLPTQLAQTEKVLSALWTYEMYFSLHPSHCIVYKVEDNFYARPEYSLVDLEKRLEILEGLTNHYDSMTQEQIEFWLDTVRYDGEIDFDKIPERSKSHPNEKASMREQFEEAAEKAAAYNEQHKHEPPERSEMER